MLVMKMNIWNWNNLGVLFMGNSLTLVPTYGRDYNSVTYVRKAWDANQDFRIVGDRAVYVNKQQVTQLKEDGITEINIRYQKLTRKVTIQL